MKSYLQYDGLEHQSGYSNEEDRVEAVLGQEVMR